MALLYAHFSCHNYLGTYHLRFNFPWPAKRYVEKFARGYQINTTFHIHEVAHELADVALMRRNLAGSGTDELRLTVKEAEWLIEALYWYGDFLQRYIESRDSEKLIDGKDAEWWELKEIVDELLEREMDVDGEVLLVGELSARLSRVVGEVSERKEVIIPAGCEVGSMKVIGSEDCCCWRGCECCEFGKCCNGSWRKED